MENISLQQDSFETLAERFNELPLFNAASPERVGNFERFIITNAGVQDSVTWTEKAQGVINHLLPENAIATVRINTNGEEPSTLVLDIPYLGIHSEAQVNRNFNPSPGSIIAMMKYTLPKSIRQSDLLHEDDLDKFISNLDAKYQGSKNFVFGDTGRPISEENMQASMEDAHTSVGVKETISRFLLIRDHKDVLDKYLGKKIDGHKYTEESISIIITRTVEKVKTRDLDNIRSNISTGMKNAPISLSLLSKMAFGNLDEFTKTTKDDTTQDLFEKTIRGLYKDDAEGILKEYRKSKINDLETSFKKCITDAFQHSASYSDRIMVRSDDGVVSWKEYVRVISVEKEINKIRDGKQKGSLQFMFGENNSTFVQFRDPDEKRSIIGALAKNRGTIPVDLETWKILEKVDMAMIGMDIPLWNFMGTAHLKEKGFEVITPISGTNDFPARVGFEFAKNKEEAEKGNVTRVMVNTTFDTVLVADTLVSKIEEVSVN